MNIAQLTKQQIDLWNTTSGTFPLNGSKIPVKEKMEREKAMEKFAKNFTTGFNRDKVNLLEDEAFKRQLLYNLGSFFKTSFNYADDELEIIIKKGFMAATSGFMKMARDFDPSIPIEDVFQASRNLWIVNTLQVMMGVPVALTPSVFAYSMLYPYSDNYLDDPSISSEEKIAFSSRFRKRLEGEKVLAVNTTEATIFDLVAMIESEWERKKYPRVYESLIAIHDAQTRSIKLMNLKAKPDNDELLSICIEKGGTSVLADGYLVKGELTPAQEEFCFGFGVVLQYIDDIQDITQDIEGKLETAFTRAQTGRVLEHYTSKALNITAKVLNDLSCFGASNLDAMKRLMNKSIQILAIEAIGKNCEYWKTEYVARFEKYSPFRYSFLKKRRSNMELNRVSFMKKIEQYIFEQETEKTAIV